MERSEQFKNMVGGERIADRQVDELIGISGALAADGVVNQAEVEFLQRWLAANAGVSDLPVVRVLYGRVAEILADGVVDQAEAAELLETLRSFSHGTFELGEVLKSTTLPLCRPAPTLTFPGLSYCFTGTFSFGGRKTCEQAIVDRGGICGSLTQRTGVLVIGAYATDSWKHSSFGMKIMKAAKMRDDGHPIAIVSEQHWTGHL